MRARVRAYVRVYVCMYVKWIVRTCVRTYEFIVHTEARVDVSVGVHVVTGVWPSPPV